jgi:hypothetical protein
MRQVWKAPGTRVDVWQLTGAGGRNGGLGRVYASMSWWVTPDRGPGDEVHGDVTAMPALVQPFRRITCSGRCERAADYTPNVTGGARAVPSRKMCRIKVRFTSARTTRLS